MNAHPGPIAIYFFDRLREIARAAGGEQWRIGRCGAVVTGPEAPTVDSPKTDQDYYGGDLVCESISERRAKFVVLMSPKVSIAIADQMLEAATSPLTIEQARVIHTWRVELECSYGRVAELSALVWGRSSNSLDGEQLCVEAERLLGTSTTDHQSLA